MKRKVDQGETQRAYVHALSDSGSHIREKERRPGRTSKRFATAEISMRSALHTPFRQIPGQTTADTPRFNSAGISARFQGGSNLTVLNILPARFRRAGGQMLFQV